MAVLDGAVQYRRSGSDSATTARFGFSNAGRFAALYRERFGVRPLRDRDGGLTVPSSVE